MKKEAYKQELEATLTKIQALGLPLNTLSDLERVSQPPPMLSAVLAESLEAVTSVTLKSELLFHLSKLGKFPDLYLAELRSLAEMGAMDDVWRNYAWELSERLDRCARPRHYDAISALLCDHQLGIGRQMLVYALTTIKARRGEAAEQLMDQVADPDLTIQILDAFGKLKHPDTAEILRQYADSDQKPYAQYARKSLKKMGLLERVAEPEELNLATDHAATTSANFDLDSWSKLVSSLDFLSDQDRGDLISLVDEAEVDEEVVRTLGVQSDDHSRSLTIRIFMDDLESPDAQFIANEDVIREIEETLRRIL